MALNRNLISEDSSGIAALDEGWFGPRLPGWMLPRTNRCLPMASNRCTWMFRQGGEVGPGTQPKMGPPTLGNRFANLKSHPLWPFRSIWTFFPNHSRIFRPKHEVIPSSGDGLKVQTRLRPLSIFSTCRNRGGTDWN